MWGHHGVPLVTEAGSHRRHGILSRGGRTQMKVVKCFLDRDAERLLRCSGRRPPGHFHNVRAGT